MTNSVTISVNIEPETKEAIFTEYLDTLTEGHWIHAEYVMRTLDVHHGSDIDEIVGFVHDPKFKIIVMAATLKRALREEKESQKKKKYFDIAYGALHNIWGQCTFAKGYNKEKWVKLLEDFNKIREEFK